MVEVRPTAQAMRELVLEDLSRMFSVHDVDSEGFTLGVNGTQTMTRVQLSAIQVERYVSDIEDSAYNAMGIEPRWKSGISLTAVHVMEEAAMATPEMSVIVDGKTIRRDPCPT